MRNFLLTIACFCVMLTSSLAFAGGPQLVQDMLWKREADVIKEFGTPNEVTVLGDRQLDTFEAKFRDKDAKINVLIKDNWIRMSEVVFAEPQSPLLLGDIDPGKIVDIKNKDDLYAFVVDESGYRQFILLRAKTKHLIEKEGFMEALDENFVLLATKTIVRLGEGKQV